MTKIGYALSSELHGPAELIDLARRAEAAGFDFATISDHYHPWVPQQGESPFAWTVLGGIAEATESIEIGTGVTCPTVRYHPAVLAQAAATAADLFEGRFSYGVGTGELLNEHVVGERWPEHQVRLSMLAEAVEITRGLWTGEEYSHHGEHYTVENARLFTRPESDPPIVVSGYGPRTAKAAAEWGDGFWTVGPQGDLVDAFEAAGGDGPTYAQMSVCYADDEERAVDAAYERWPIAGLKGELNSHLPTPVHFDHAVQMVDRSDIAEGSTVTDPDPQAHVENVREFVDAGFDHVQIHDVGEDPEGFFELYEGSVLPAICS